MSEASLQVTRLTKSYGGNNALNGLNLKVGPGEIYGLLEATAGPDFQPRI